MKHLNHGWARRIPQWLHLEETSAPNPRGKGGYKSFIKRKSVRDLRRRMKQGKLD